MSWRNAPRIPARRCKWLKRFIVVLSKRLAEHTFPDAWYRGKFYAGAESRRRCEMSLERCRRELAALIGGAA